MYHCKTVQISCQKQSMVCLLQFQTMLISTASILLQDRLMAVKAAINIQTLHLCLLCVPTDKLTAEEGMECRDCLPEWVPKDFSRSERLWLTSSSTSPVSTTTSVTTSTIPTTTTTTTITSTASASPISTTATSPVVLWSFPAL